MRRRSRRPATPGRRTDQTFSGVLAAAAAASIVFFGAVRWWCAGPAWVSIFLVAALMAIRILLRPGQHKIVAAPGLLFLSAVPLYVLVRVFWKNVAPAEAHSEFLIVTGYLAAFACWSQLKEAGARWRFWISSFLLLASILCWYALILHMRGERMVLWLPRPEAYGLRASGTFGSPNHFGHFLVVAFSFALAFAFAPRAGLALRMISFYSLVLIPCALALTLSRGALIGLAVSALCIPLVYAIRQGGRRAWIATGLMPVILCGVTVTLWFGVPTWKDRILEATLGEDFRMRLWKDTWTLWKSEPIWGSGPGSFPFALSPHRHHLYEPNLRPLQAHNEPLHALAEYGLVGTALLVVAGGWTLWRLVRALRRGDPADADTAWIAALVSAWAGTLAQSCMEFNLHIPGNVLLLTSLTGLGVARLASLGRISSGPSSPQAVRLLALSVLVFCLSLAADTIRMTRCSRLQEEWSFADRHHQPVAGLPAAREAARIMPGFTEAHRFIGGCLQREAFWLKRQPDRMAPLLLQAETHLLEAIRQNRLDLDARITLARVRLLQGRKDEAVDLANQVAADAPVLVFYHLEQARILVDAKRHAEALDAFKRARELDIYSESAWAGVHAMKRLLGLPILTPAGPPPRPDTHKPSPRTNP